MIPKRTVGRIADHTGVSQSGNGRGAAPSIRFYWDIFLAVALPRKLATVLTYFAALANDIADVVWKARVIHPV